MEKIDEYTAQFKLISIKFPDKCNMFRFLCRFILAAKTKWECVNHIQLLCATVHLRHELERLRCLYLNGIAISSI